MPIYVELVPDEEVHWTIWCECGHQFRNMELGRYLCPKCNKLYRRTLTHTSVKFKQIGDVCIQTPENPEMVIVLDIEYAQCTTAAAQLYSNATILVDDRQGSDIPAAFKLGIQQGLEGYWIGGESERAGGAGIHFQPTWEEEIYLQK